MASENLCLHNKYGYCKFGGKCRRFHVQEICQETMCEIQKCCKRHPKKCKFFEQFNYCKFGEYYLFSHNVFNDFEIEVKQIITRLETLEKVIQEKEKAIQTLNEKLTVLEIQNKKIEIEFRDNLLKVSETVAKEVVDQVVSVVSKQQDDIEKRNDENINSLREQLAIISSLLQPPAPPHAQVPLTHHSNTTGNLRNQKTDIKYCCKICGKNFDTSTMLNAHTPNSSKTKFLDVFTILRHQPRF